MLIYVDVYNGAGTQRLGDGPIQSVTSVKITDKIDALRTFNVSVQALDYRAFTLLTPGRQVKVRLQLDTGTKLLAEGFIENISVSDKLTGAGLQVKCRGLMREMAYINTRLNRVYSDVAISTIVNQLVALAGWTATVDSGLGNASIVFDGVSVLKALQDLAKATGLHFRHDTGKAITFGALGDNADLRLVQPFALPNDIYQNDNIAFVSDITTQSGEGTIINWMLPLGNKSDDTDRVTLANSGISSPYVIQSDIGPDGSTYYYIEDATSIAAYGRREVVEVFNDIKSTGTSGPEVTGASNQLYYAAAARLGRYAYTEETYTVNVLKSWQRITEIGQKLLLVYRGEALQFGTPHFVYVDVNELLWIVGQTITVDDTGLRIKFTVSNRDVVDEVGAVQLVAQTITDYNQQKV